MRLMLSLHVTFGDISRLRPRNASKAAFQNRMLPPPLSRKAVEMADVFIGNVPQRMVTEFFLLPF